MIYDKYNVTEDPGAFSVQDPPRFGGFEDALSREWTGGEERLQCLGGFGFFNTATKNCPFIDYS